MACTTELELFYNTDKICFTKKLHSQKQNPQNKIPGSAKAIKEEHDDGDSHEEQE